MKKNGSFFVDEDGDVKGGNIIKLVCGIVGIVLILILLNPISCVSEGQRGVRYTFGKADEIVLTPGINFHAPLVGRIRSWTIKPHTYDLIIDIASRGAVSKDNQIIGAEGKIVWNLDPTKIVPFVKQFEGDISNVENIIKNSAYEALKSVIGKYSIYDLPGKMGEIATEAYQALKGKLSAYPIEVTQFNVTNFDWSSDFDQQINATMRMAQQVKEAEQAANKAEQDNRRLAIEAEAKAKALVAEAEGRKTAAELNAAAAIAEAQGKNEANRLLSQNQNVEWRRLELEIELEKAKRWDGRQVPTYVPLNPAGGIVTLPGQR